MNVVLEKSHFETLAPISALTLAPTLAATLVPTLAPILAPRMVDVLKIKNIIYEVLKDHYKMSVSVRNVVEALGASV